MVLAGLRRELKMSMSRRMELSDHLARLDPGSPTNLSLTRTLIRGGSDKRAQEQVGGKSDTKVTVYPLLSLLRLFSMEP